MNVALFGQMAAGKSSISRMLVDSGYTRLSFAGPLKNISELAYGPIEKSGQYPVTDERTGLESFISGREVLQRVGQSIKSHDRDFWLRCFFRTAQNYGNTPLVVDDGRFIFERDSLRDNGWLIVGINTPWATRRERYRDSYGRYPTAEEETHASEVEIPQILLNCDMLVDGTESPFVNADKIVRRAGLWPA